MGSSAALVEKKVDFVLNIYFFEAVFAPLPHDINALLCGNDPAAQGENQMIPNIDWKKLLQAATLSAFALMPVFGATSQAAPPAHAPAWGYRDNDNRNERDDDRDDDDDDDYDDRNNDNRGNDNRGNNNKDWKNRHNQTVQTLEGVVTNDLQGRRFVLRLNNGQKVLVRSDEREPKRLSEGDRAQVRGYFNRNDDNRYDDRNSQNNTRWDNQPVFRASEIRILANRNDYSNGRRIITGVVTNVRSDRRFTLRADNRSFDVSSPSRLPRNVSNGDRVRVAGDLQGNDITNANIILVNDKDDGNYNNGNYNNGNYGNNNYNGNFEVNFPATIVSSDERNNTIRVRGDNNREYSVRTKEAHSWSRGDRVRIKGRVQNGVITATDIDKR